MTGTNKHTQRPGHGLEIPLFKGLGETADSRAKAGKVPDEPGILCSARKKVLKKLWGYVTSTQEPI